MRVEQGDDGGWYVIGNFGRYSGPYRKEVDAKKHLMQIAQALQGMGK